VGDVDVDALKVVGPGSPDGDLVIHSQTSIFPHSGAERELIGKWVLVAFEPGASP
jgi:hypothetical protein